MSFIGAGSRIFLFYCLFLMSCSSIRLAGRVEKDISLTNQEKLKGEFSKIDTFKNGKIVKYDLFINLQNDKVLDFKLYYNDSLTRNEKLNGRIKRGYFKVKRRYMIDFIVGPLIWVLSDNIKYIGLTKENNLVIINSSSASLFLIVLPIMVGGNQQEIEYFRIK